MARREPLDDKSGKGLRQVSNETVLEPGNQPQAQLTRTDRGGRSGGGC